jgi:hypothetical protein
MTVRIQKRHSALKHAGYSATSILPGESAAEFAKLHQELISEFTPNGAFEDEIVAAMAHLLWRKKNLATFRIAELAQHRMTQIRGAMVPGMGVPKSDESVEFERTFIEKWHAAETQARNELGELYALVEMGEEATVDRLMKELEVQERLDAMIDRCIKRLLLVRGLKSMSIGTTSAAPESLPSPSRAT